MTSCGREGSGHRRPSKKGWTPFVSDVLRSHVIKSLKTDVLEQSLQGVVHEATVALSGSLLAMQSESRVENGYGGRI